MNKALKAIYLSENVSRRKSTGRPRKIEDAAEWLRELLASGPVNIRTVKARVEGLAFSLDTLKRAKKQLGVKSLCKWCADQQKNT